MEKILSCSTSFFMHALAREVSPGPSSQSMYLSFRPCTPPASLIAAAAAFMPRTCGSTRRLPSGMPCMLIPPVLISVGEIPTSVAPLPPAGEPAAGAGVPGVGACLPGAGVETAGEVEPPGGLPLEAAAAFDPAGADALGVEGTGEAEAEGEG